MLFETSCQNATLPFRATVNSAGYDFYASEDFVVPAKGQTIVQTGIRTNFPQGIVLFLKSRSGLAAKSWLSTEAGVIDADYRGLVGVILRNMSDEDFHGSIGDRICQGVFLTLASECYPEATAAVERVGGFGSTGSN